MKPLLSLYQALPERFYDREVERTRFPNPQILHWNSRLAEDLSLTFDEESRRVWTELLCGQTSGELARPVAMAYSGHQFGHFVPTLGDGRALLLGELKNSDGQIVEIHLKGSGRTAFSRRGDGRAALGPVIREYIISEAMHAFGIPTTRSLAILTTGEMVQRESDLPGGILARTAKSHIRVGTFEYFACRKDSEGIKLLADLAIERLYPELSQSKNKYLSFFEHAIDRQARLIAQWMSFGFIHGVMNTDNMAVSGETIDYGPCAFMDEFDPAQVFSSIDRHGRYAYQNQPMIAKWNLSCLGSCLIELFDSEPLKAEEKATAALNQFESLYYKFWLELMSKKIGILQPRPSDAKLVEDFLHLLQEERADFTNSFRSLARYVQISDNESARKTPNKSRNTDPADTLSPSRLNWLTRWNTRLKQTAIPDDKIVQALVSANPAIIPRNHRVEQTIQAAVHEGNLKPLDRLVQLLQTPFADLSENDLEFARLPLASERVEKTFCGT